MDKGVRVEKTHERGRHLVARRSFEPGDVVVSQWPYAAVLFNAEISRFCNYCFRSATNLRRCSRSKFASYCSRECQLRDWKEGYRNECDFLVQSAPRIPPASVRLAAHVAWKYKKELEHSLEKTDMWNSYLGVESLVDHWDHLPDAKLKAFAEMGFFITNICPHLPEEGLSLDEPIAKSFARLLAKFTFNNHTISSASTTNLGCGVYPLLAMANHSSWPNCIQRFDGKLCELRAIRPIRAGEEITITYVDLMNTSIEMHEILKKDYLFDLIPSIKETRNEKWIAIDKVLTARVWKRGQPSWILTEKDHRLTSVVRSPDAKAVGGVMVLAYEETETEPSEWEMDSTEMSKKPTPNTQRSMTVCFWGDWFPKRNDIVIEIAKKLKDIQDSFFKGQELYDQSFFKEAASVAQESMRLCDDTLYGDVSLAETHILCIRILDLVRKATIDEGWNWRLVLDCYRSMIHHHDTLFPHYWSERGSHLAALAKLESSYGGIKKAIQSAQEAIHVLRITDGSGEVLEEMKKLEKNLHHEINFREQENLELKI